jgi:hypothetical protein
VTSTPVIPDKRRSRADPESIEVLRSFTMDPGSPLRCVRDDAVVSVQKAARPNGRLFARLGRAVAEEVPASRRCRLQLLLPGFRGAFSVAAECREIGRSDRVAVAALIDHHAMGGHHDVTAAQRRVAEIPVRIGCRVQLHLRRRRLRGSCRTRTRRAGRHGDVERLVDWLVDWPVAGRAEDRPRQLVEQACRLHAWRRSKDEHARQPKTRNLSPTHRLDPLHPRPSTTDGRKKFSAGSPMRLRFFTVARARRQALAVELLLRWACIALARAVRSTFDGVIAKRAAQA